MNDTMADIKQPEATEANGAANAGEALMVETLSQEQIDDLKSRAARADENWERLLRTTADFENFKKRAVREREEAVRSANESIVKKLVPVLDNFEMALAAAAQNRDLRPEAAQSLQEGINMILQQLK